MNNNKSNRNLLRLNNAVVAGVNHPKRMIHSDDAIIIMKNVHIHPIW